MKAIVVGAVESTRIALRAIAEAPGWMVSAVVTLPLSLAGRHSDFVDLRPEATACGAELIEAANSNAPEIVESVRSLGPDMMFVIGWSQICKREFRDAANGNVVGYHPAPLPRLRGRAVIPWTILLDEKITASSLFWIDDGVDSGPLLGQQFFHVAEDETATTLYARHMKALDGLLRQNLNGLRDRIAKRQPQDERHATYAARRTPKDGEIDWRRPANEIARLIRATTRPYPGAFTSWKGGKLVIWGASVWADAGRHAAVPGQIIRMDQRRLAICCGEGAIETADWSIDGDADFRAHAVLGERN